MIRRFWRVSQSVERLPIKGSIPAAPASKAGSSPVAVPGQRNATGSRTGVLTVPHPVVSRRQVLAGLLAAPAVKYFLPPVGGWRPWEDGFTTGNLIYKGTERYSFGATDVRAFYGTAGDGVALVSRAHPYLTSDTVWFLKEPRAYEEVYVPPLNPDSLEEIEIEIRPPANAFEGLGSLLQEERVAIAAIGRELTRDGERARRLFESLLLGSRGETPK